jgi:hypothetical protein
MTIPASLIETLGFAGAPAALAGATLGAFEFVERVSSKDAKESLTQYIISFDPKRATALPRGASDLFKLIFGNNHFTWRCLSRSAYISIAGIIFFMLIAYANKGNEYFFWDIVSLERGYDEPFMISEANYFRMAVFWIPFSIIIDYFMLFKTRIILNVLRKRQISVAGTGIICFVDLLLGYYFFFTILGAFQVLLHLGELSVWDISHEMRYVTRAAFGILWPINSVSSFFYAGMLPSVWLWMYIGSVVIAATIVHSKGVLGSLRWCLDVNSAPFRSIGIVAAAVVFVLTAIPFGLMRLFGVSETAKED